MKASPDADELAAIVADGSAFDWAAVGADRRVRTLAALWRVVRAQAPGELAGVRAPRAHLPWWLSLLVFVALFKAVAALLVAAFAPGSVTAIQVVMLLSFTVVGSALVYGGERDVRARHLGALLLLTGAVVTNPLLNQGSAGWSTTPLWIAWLRAPVVEAFMPWALWLFVRHFPASARSPRLERQLRMGLRASLWVGSLLLLANLAIGGGLALPGLRVFDRRAAAGMPYYWPLQLVLLIPALLLMIRRRRDCDPAEKGKVTAFLLALLAAALPALVIMALGGLSSPFRPWLLSHFTVTGVILYSGLVLFPLSTTYAVLAHQVMRVDLVIRNAARYVLAQGALTIAILGPLVLFAWYAYQHRDMAVGALVTDSVGLSLLALAALAATLLVARQPLLTYIDRRLGRDGISLAQALDDFSRRASGGLGLGDVADALSRAVSAAFHPETVALLVADHQRGVFVPLGAPMRSLSRTSFLAEALAGTHDPVVVDLEEPGNVARLLPRADQEWLADAGVSVLVPLVASGGQLCAVLALGRMANERAYAEPDLRFLSAISAAAAPVVESRLLRTSSQAPKGRLDQVDWDDESGRECSACGRVWAADANTCGDCSQPTRPMAIPARLHGKFALVRRLGAGGMGVVYLATDEALDRPVALKALPGVAPQAVERMRREARAMARVSHPALATIHGVESWRASPVLVVEFLAGGTLADRLKQGPMAESAVVTMALQVLGGLGHLHGAGLLHRDLKPSNIGFSADGAAKVLDFGLSRLVDGEPGQPPVFGSEDAGVSTHGPSPRGVAVSGLAGTPLYMSPELLDGRSPSAQDDLWALAVVMSEALAGRHPWAGLGVDEVMRRIRTTGAAMPSPGTGCSAPLAALLASALSKDEKSRPRTADAFKRDMAGLTV